jgi:putative hydrolase of the HAD superfamily
VSPRFDGILFDAGGVLMVPDPYQTAIALTPFGATSDASAHVRAHYAAITALEGPALAADEPSLEHVDWLPYRQAFVTSVGVSEHAVGDAMRALDELWSPYLWRHPLGASVAALSRLHHQRVPIGVVSNASGQVEHVLRYLGICQVGVGAGVPVSCVVDSHVVGIAKPDPAIFTFGLDALGLAPERVAYVGDSVINDVGGARAAGLVPLLLDPYGDRAHLAGIERITSLHELLTWI